LIRDGRLVAALCASDLSPRAWTAEEIELVKDTAQRTWDAIERARAEEQLREADARKDEFLAMPRATTAAVAAIDRRADEQPVERRVLVIDDNQDAANATAMLVAEMDGDARVAYDGESALGMLQE
jgi:GAF domain-containing protein